MTTFKNALRSDDWLTGLLADRVLKISIKIAALQEEWYIFEAVSRVLYTVKRWGLLSEL